MKKTLIWITRIVLVLVALLLLGLLSVHLYLKEAVVRMPGESFAGPAPAADTTLEAEAARLRDYVEALAYERNFYHPEALIHARDFITQELAQLGLDPRFQSYDMTGEEIRRIIADRNTHLKRPHHAYEGGDQHFTNIYVVIDGHQNPQAMLVIGSHYDSVYGSPGANDNGSSVAGLLEIARYLKSHPPTGTVLLVAFTCEEYPLGGPGNSGSEHFADWLLGERKQQSLPPPYGMIALDTLGNFSDTKGSQLYPFPLKYYYPEQGNFIAFVSDSFSREFLRSCIGTFREVAGIPSEGVAIPSGILPDVMRSDHAPFIARGVPAIMVTDTANFRVPNPYHSSNDTPEKINYLQLARVISGVTHVAENLGTGN